MWGLAGVFGSGMTVWLAPSPGHPAGGPQLSSHSGKTLFPASSCLLKCPSDQTREGPRAEKPGRGACALVADFFFPRKNSVLGLSLKLLRGPRTWAESQEQWATLGAYKLFSPLAWIKVLKRIPEELWASPPGSHQRPAEARRT